MQYTEGVFIFLIKKEKPALYKILNGCSCHLMYLLTVLASLKGV
jgi:hypothetical protein